MVGYATHNKKIVEDQIHSTWKLDADATPEPNRVTFEITQKDPKIIYKIRTLLGFGKVESITKKNGQVYFRYFTSKREHILRLTSLFNGNLILNKRQRQFEKVIASINQMWKFNLQMMVKCLSLFFSLKHTLSPLLNKFQRRFKRQPPMLDEERDTERARQRVAVSPVCRSSLQVEPKFSWPSTALVVRC